MLLRTLGRFLPRKSCVLDDDAGDVWAVAPDVELGYNRVDVG